MLNKLDNFGPIYVINLKRRPERLSKLIDNFNQYNVTNYTIVEAIDGSTEDLHQYVNGNYGIRNSELACTLSHLKAIKQWYETSDNEYAIIIEDDLSFETVDKWSFSWQEFIDDVDFDYDLFQLHIINEGMELAVHKWNTNDFSNAAYVVTRHFAKDIFDKLIDKNGKYNLPDNPLADHFLYRTYNSYSAPLFATSLETNSDINPDHRQIHETSRNKVLSFWESGGLTLNKKN
jgi:GR25 family glycosyltransferase involved in LPS biosynthesis